MVIMGGFKYCEGISKFGIWLMSAYASNHFITWNFQKLLCSTPQSFFYSQSLSEALWLL